MGITLLNNSDDGGWKASVFHPPIIEPRGIIQVAGKDPICIQGVLIPGFVHIFIDVNIFGFVPQRWHCVPTNVQAVQLWFFRFPHRHEDCFAPIIFHLRPRVNPLLLLVSAPPCLRHSQGRLPVPRRPIVEGNQRG
jgi:hypothetical protein